MKEPRYARRRRSPPGTAPGTLSADPAARAPLVQAIRYSPEGIEESNDILPCQPGGTLWLNVDGLGDTALLQRIGDTFGLHPLALEDVVNTHQRPKAEDYEAHQFIVLRMPHPGGWRLSTEQVTIFLGDGFVITFQEKPGDVFDPVRARLRNPLGQMRRQGADYLCYALLDAVIDSFFPLLEVLGEKLEALEDRVVMDPHSAGMGEIHILKRELLNLRAAVLPLRDLVSTLQREASPHFSEHTRLYLRDCHDHAVQLNEMIQTYREIAAGLVDILLSSQANRTNEVMRVLTLIATIFIPLTFIVGVYGMNFEWMPELGWRWGYPAVLAGMALIAAALVFWFWRKGWLGRGR